MRGCRDGVEKDRMEAEGQEVREVEGVDG